MYSHACDHDPPDLRTFRTTARERPNAPVSAGTNGAVVAADRGARALSGGAKVKIAIVGATGYVGSELIRLLAMHPHVEIAGLIGRERKGDPIGGIHAHLATQNLHVYDTIPDDAEAVFLALPHGTAAARIDEFLGADASGSSRTVIDMGPDFRLQDPAMYPAYYNFEHPRQDLLPSTVYGLPELHRAELAAAGRTGRVIVGSPGCYATTSILALTPLARAGLIADVVIDAKSGVSGAGRDPKADLVFGEVNESVRAYGIFTHRHIAEIEQELLGQGATRDANPGADGIDFLPHLIPMTRGILAACHVRTTRPVSQAELDDLYAAAFADEAFVTVTKAPPATKHVLGSNEFRTWVGKDERTNRVLAIGVLDNLVKGAAGQAIQAFNVVHGLPETTGLLQLPLAP